MFQFPINPIIGDTFTPASGKTYQWNGTGWILQGTGVSFPSGVVMPFAGSVAPSGFLLCDGASYTTAAQPALFVALGYAYGGAGANFNVPDLRGRVIAGKDNMGGVAANRITAAGSGITGTTLGAAGGAESVILTAAQLAAHNHVINIVDGTHSHSSPDSAAFVTGGPGTFVPGAGSGVQGGLQATTTANVSNISANSNNAGGGTLHQNMPPSMVMNYIIKT